MIGTVKTKYPIFNQGSSSSSSSSRPPRDLTSLLSELRSPSDVERCHWAAAFRQHLRAAGRADLEAAMDFCVVAGVLRSKGEEIKAKGSNAWRRDDVDAERIELLEVGGSFSKNMKQKLDFNCHQLSY